MRFYKTGHDFKVQICSPTIAGITSIIPANLASLASLVVLLLVRLAERAHQLRKDLTHVKLARFELDLGGFFRVFFRVESVCLGLVLLLFFVVIYDRERLPVLFLGLVAAGTSTTRQKSLLFPPLGLLQWIKPINCILRSVRQLDCLSFGGLLRLTKSDKSASCINDASGLHLCEPLINVLERNLVGLLLHVYLFLAGQVLDHLLVRNRLRGE